ERQAVDRKGAELDALIVEAAVERLGVGLDDRHVAVHMVVIVRVVDTVIGAVDRHPVDQDTRRLRPEGVVDLPDPHILDHERMPEMGAVAFYPFAKFSPYLPSQWDSFPSNRTNGNVRTS